LDKNKTMTYRVKDVEKIIDRDRNTILRWEREGRIPHVRKDSRGWRLYTSKDVKKIINFISKTNPYYRMAMDNNRSIAMNSGFTAIDKK
jgi:DNA-binding transcriptional MerR regulator